MSTATAERASALGRRTDVLPDVSVLLVAIVWGSSYVAMRQVGGSLGVGAFLSLRFGVAAVALSCAAAVRQVRRDTHREWHLTRGVLRVGTGYGLILFAVLGLETWGVRHTSASNAGFLVAITVVVVPVAQWFLYRVSTRPAVYTTAALTLAGTALISLHNGLDPNPGDLAVLAAGVLRGVQIAIYGRSDAHHDPLGVCVVQMWVVCLAGVSLTSLHPSLAIGQISQLGSGTWLLIIYLALPATAFAFLAQQWAAPRIGSTRVGLILALEPLFAGACAVALGGEHLGAVSLIGGGLVLCGSIGGRVMDQRATRNKGGPMPMELTT